MSLFPMLADTVHDIAVHDSVTLVGVAGDLRRLRGFTDRGDRRRLSKLHLISCHDFLTRAWGKGNSKLPNMQMMLNAESCNGTWVSWLGRLDQPPSLMMEPREPMGAFRRIKIVQACQKNLHPLNATIRQHLLCKWTHFTRIWLHAHVLSLSIARVHMKLKTNLIFLSLGDIGLIS
ncbi:hypothetical protein EGW08_006284 [Elysia chlorotica]|uniref:Uncharacterized protein n=1 Tax=Elysia chlorotica TaxID=188477 RepID=A0A433TWQ0_ELYCH|nr:hypothetical protein EGW08_006284 [Elysia chlorotica]